MKHIIPALIALLACGGAAAQARPDMGKFLATGGVSQV